MAKIQIKSEKLTPFGGIFSIMEKFDSMLSPVIDSTLGQRCSSIFGYQFSEIVRSLMSVYFCGGSCVEDVTSQLMRHLSYHPTLRTCSSDTILRAIKELTQENISYTSDKGKTYDFNTADKLNALLIKALVSTGELNEVETYDVDFDHQFLETEKYDAKPTYKTIMSRLDTKAFGLKKTSRIKAFVFRFISVPAKWIMTARQYVLNIYTENRAYAKPFKTEFG